LRRAVETPVGQGRLFGSQSRSSLSDAAFYNGVAGHFLEYDDLSHPAYSHISCHLVPPALSLAEHAGRDGASVLCAYVAGLEVESRLGRMLNPEHYEHGWHSTSTIGTIGATVTACVALGLANEAIVNALGIGASTASGLRLNIGSLAKPIHGGAAARNGVVAALLAAEGWTGHREVFESRLGFIELYSGGAKHETDPWNDLGESWGILAPYGLALKPYPTCGATHTTVEAALRLHQHMADRMIDSIDVSVTPLAADILRFKWPADEFEAKFCLPYLIAVGLTEGKMDLTSFSGSRLNDAGLRALADRVAINSDDPRIADCAEFAAALRLTFEDGGSVEEVVLTPKGRPERWMSEEEIRAKFLDCTSPSLGSSRSEHAYKELRSLMELRSLSPLIERLW
jgi:2-methylcitrate dehydratase PrpD